MSSGISVGDFIYLIRHARGAYKKCVDSGIESREISQQIRYLQKILKNLRRKVFKHDTRLDHHMVELAGTMNDCKHILEDLQVLLGKFESLSDDGKPLETEVLLQSPRFAKKIELLNQVGVRLRICTSSLSVLLDLIKLRATSKVEEKLDITSSQIRGKFESMKKTILAMAVEARTAHPSDDMPWLSLSIDDDKEIWRAFRRELIGRGFRSIDLDGHKDLLKEYLLELYQSRLLDETAGSLNQNIALASKPGGGTQPCKALWVENISMETSEVELKALFSKQDGYRKITLWLKDTELMGLVEFHDASFAAKALHDLQGHLLHNSMHGGIQLAYSKDPLIFSSGSTFCKYADSKRDWLHAKTQEERIKQLGPIFRVNSEIGTEIPMETILNRQAAVPSPDAPRSAQTLEVSSTLSHLPVKNRADEILRPAKSFCDLISSSQTTNPTVSELGSENRQDSMRDLDDHSSSSKHSFPYIAPQHRQSGAGYSQQAYSSSYGPASITSHPGSSGYLSFGGSSGQQYQAPQFSQPAPRRRYSNGSDISQSSSVASIADSIFSLASASSMSSLIATSGAGDRLLAILREDSVLKPLYQEALDKVALQRLERNLRRLFKRFAVDLRKEAENPQQRGAAHFVRCRARNSAHIICGSLDRNTPKLISKNLFNISAPQEAVEDLSDNSSDSDNQEDEPADLRELEAFIVTSRAFAALRSNLRLFIYPEESRAPVNDEKVVDSAIGQPGDEVQADVPAEVVAEDVIGDETQLRLHHSSTTCSSLESSMISEERKDAVEPSLLERVNGYLAKSLTMSVQLMISWVFLYLSLGIFMHIWQLTYMYPIARYSLARASVVDSSNIESLIYLRHTQITASSIWNFSGVLAVFAAAPLSRLLKKYFPREKRTSRYGPEVTALGDKQIDHFATGRVVSKLLNGDLHLEDTGFTSVITKKISWIVLLTVMASIGTLFLHPDYVFPPTRFKEFNDYEFDGSRHISINYSPRWISPPYWMVPLTIFVGCIRLWPAIMGLMVLISKMFAKSGGPTISNRVDATSFIISTPWQKPVELFGNKLCFGAALRDLFKMEPKIPYGKTRVRWKCKCGQKLYDDFTELKQGAAQRLEDRLNRRDDASNRSVRSRLSFKSFSSTVSTSIESLKSTFGWKEAELPQHELQTIANERPSNLNPPLPEPLFLLLCHSEGVYAKKLFQLSISDLKSDKKLFAVLRANYKQMRARWWSFLSFRTLVGIKFVKFEIYKKSALVDIREKDAIPPPNRVGPQGEYRYAPMPPDVIPPVGENHLMHLFQHPGHAEDEPVCLERFPKKLRERLAVRGSAPTVLGWGLSLEEGWDCTKTWVVGFVVFVVGSALWAVLWTVFEKSIQDAFAVSAYMVSFAVVTVGFTQAMVGGLG